MRLMHTWAWLAVLTLAALLVGCGGGGADSGGGGSGTGTFSLGLTDASTVDYRAIYVTVDEVRVHQDEGSRWHVVATPRRTYNLLALVNGVRAELALAELETGHYSQMRLIIGPTPDDGVNVLSRKHPHANYVIDQLDTAHPLKIPSGFQTGIKLVHGFDLTAGQVTDLVLDFDANRSVVKAGNSGKWLLKPTIKVVNTREAAIVEGRVTPVDPEGVLIAAQRRDPHAADPADRVVAVASTVSDERGYYTLFLPRDFHVLVAYRDGYLPACALLDSAANARLQQDFTLQATRTGSLYGTVLVPGAGGEVHVTLSVRQRARCPGQTESVEIEVKSVNVANGERYALRLPPGNYGVVASTHGRRSQVQAVTVDAGVDKRLDIRF